ncbi:MAG: YfhO family protein, partial [Prolixibacteraceae bacterium]|nr:YfhO family protein [Prolixibacteraceae bacterium]
KPATAGPYYFGALVVFLFVLGLFVVKGPMKWWLLFATVVSFFLSWGKNMMWLTSFLLDYLPMYNKFRAPEMILVIAAFTFPLVGILGLHQILSGKVEKKDFRKGFTWALLITGGLSLLLFASPAIAGSFSSPFDRGMPDWLLPGILADRKELLKMDALRSFVIIAVGAGLLYLWHTGKIKNNVSLIVGLGILILFDLWGVDKRYLNSDNFELKRMAEHPFKKMPVDEAILKDKDISYRVLPLQNPWSDARTSYFHKNVGGYHAAKLRRYNELIDHELTPEINQMIKSFQTVTNADSIFAPLSAINMMNTRYLIYDLNKAPIVNPKALGNAWFVRRFKLVNNADEEIAALKNFDASSEAIIDKRFAQFVEGKNFQKDETGFIKLTEYQPNYLKYHAKAASGQLTVFSEIYYDKGWNAFVDGKPTPIFRVNYVLRAIILPAGEHTIEFRFKPKSYYTGNKISLASSFLLLLILAGFGFVEIRKMKFEKTARK